MITAVRAPFILSACIAILSVNPNVRGDEAWTAFRGPDGDGVVRSGAELPLHWSPEKNIDWRTELPGKGWSSPVCDDDRIYVTTAIPAESGEGSEEAAKEFSLSLLVIDAASGKLLKTIPVMQQTEDRSPKIHSKNSHASPTPIVDGDRIFVHFGYQGTACVSKQGEILWTNRDLYFSPQHGNGGTPILVDNRLIFTCDGDKEPKIVALVCDPDTDRSRRSETSDCSRQ